MFEAAQKDPNLVKDNPSYREKVSKKTSLAYFLVFCGWPFCFYFSYVYCGGILKEQFHYTKEALIYHNFIVAIFNLTGLFIFIKLTERIHPLLILKAKLIIYIPFLCLVPFLLSNVKSELMIMVIQICGVVFGNSTIPAKAIFLMHFPVFKRFRYASFITAIAHITLYIVTSFGLVYATKLFGIYGIMLISIPATLSFFDWCIAFSKT